MSPTSSLEDLRCPTCGAPLPVKHRFVKVATCDFCESVSVIHDDGPESTAYKAAVTRLPSMFFVNARGKLEGRPFEVLGRLRYLFHDGYWDEWLLGFDDGEPGWLQEDAGNFTFFAKTDVTTAAPDYRQVQVGETLDIAGRRVFVTEKGEATIGAGEGQLAFEVFAGQSIRYVDGTADGTQVSIEYAPQETEICVGRAIPRARIEVEEDDFESYY